MLTKIVFVLIISLIAYLGYKQLTKKGVKGSGGATGGNGETEVGEGDNEPTPKPKRNNGE